MLSSSFFALDIRIETGTTGQAEQDRPNRTGRKGLAENRISRTGHSETGQAEQGIQNWTGRTGQNGTGRIGHLELDRQNRTGRTVQAEWYRQNGTSRTGQAEWDKQNRTGSTGQTEQDRQTITGKTGQAKRPDRSSGQSFHDRTTMVRQPWQDRKERQPEKDNQKKTSRTRQPARDRGRSYKQNKTAIIGLQGQEQSG
jgi:hypothetical protein